MKAIWNSTLIRFLRETVFLYFNLRIPQAAACLAYFVLLTVFPVLICITALLGQLHIDTAAVLAEMGGILPQMSLDVLESYLNYVSSHQSIALFLGGLAGCWFSGAAAYRTITRVMFDVYADARVSFFRNMVASVIFPFALLLTIALSVVVVVTGQQTLQELPRFFPFLSETLLLWSWLRYLLLFAVFFLFVVAVLLMAAPPSFPRRPLLLSGLVSSLALVLASAVFSWFIGVSSRYSLVYGSLVSLIVLLVWLYLCGHILFLGIVFVWAWYQARRKKRRQDKG